MMKYDDSVITRMDFSELITSFLNRKPFILGKKYRGHYTNGELLVLYNEEIARHEENNLQIRLGMTLLPLNLIPNVKIQIKNGKVYLNDKEWTNSEWTFV